MAGDGLRRLGYAGILHIIPHFVENARPVTQAERTEARRRLGLPGGVFIVGVFGFLSRAKRIDVISDAVDSVARVQPVLACFVGEAADAGDWIPVLRRVEDGEHSRVTGYVSDEVMELYFRAVDVCVNLRYPTQGESSGTLAQALSHGIPSVVSNVGSFAELPDDVVYKVPVGDGERCLLAETLTALAASPEEREKRGKAAIHFLGQEYALEEVTSQYCHLIDRMLAVRQWDPALQAIAPYLPASLPQSCLSAVVQSLIPEAKSALP